MVNVTFLDDAGRLPAPLRQPEYAFGEPLPQAALQAAVANADVQTQLLGWGQVAQGPPPPAGGIGIPGAGKCLLAEPCGSWGIGDEAPVAPVGPLQSTKAVTACMLGSGTSEPEFVEWVASQRVARFRDEKIDLCASEVGDCRIMKPRFELGVRNRGFSNEVLEMFEEFEFDGFPKGPWITLGTTTAPRSQGLAWQMQAREWPWPVAARVPPGDRSVRECQLICVVFHAVQWVDQCDPSNLVGAELLVSNPDFNAADIIVGWAETRGAGNAPDALMSYAANRLKDKAAIMREKRNAIDESRLGGKGNPEKGKGKGGKS
ncbi:unnamed protein product [Prorocentrum cordatum]|uniref:Uncharacterized protein n=1 Tax=Prorocentrum cordatum TaxID=2364126 RepID=A0ABN9T757_9DINO|nr:unnamed protein product [Polarella glacialis]